MFAPKARSGSTARVNDTANTTPAKKIGVKARIDAAVICAVRSIPRNVSIGTSALTTSDASSAA